jgi:hypothetical protein
LEYTSSPQRDRGHFLEPARRRSGRSAWADRAQHLARGSFPWLIQWLMAVLGWPARSWAYSSGMAKFRRFHTFAAAGAFAALALGGCTSSSEDVVPTSAADDHGYDPLCQSIEWHGQVYVRVGRVPRTELASDLNDARMPVCDENGFVRWGKVNVEVLEVRQIKGQAPSDAISVDSFPEKERPGSMSSVFEPVTVPE